VDFRFPALAAWLFVQGNCMLYVDGAVGQFMKRSAAIIAVKGGRVKQHNCCLT